MDKFLNYFENEDFVQWALNPTPELDKFWNNYFREHPSERKEAENARLLLTQIKAKKENADTEQILKLYSGIINRIGRKNKKQQSRRLVVHLMRYAAVALTFLIIGALIVIQYNKNLNIAKYQPVVHLQDESEARLVLADGKKIILNEKESTIEYSPKGQIIINSQDTIKKQESASSTEMNQLIMPFGKNSSILLPDGTLAYVNAGSRLVYPTTFQGKSREVFLMGEGFFKVAHNPEIPFVVKTNDISVVAYGTSFNIAAYPTDKIIETVLVEGKVVLREGSFNIFKKDVELTPGNLASFNRETLETVTRKVNISDYVAWHEGFLNFQSTDLNRIVVKLERYYNIKLYLDNPMLGMRRISGKLELREEKDKVLGVLASTARAELFKINETTYGLK